MKDLFNYIKQIYIIIELKKKGGKWLKKKNKLMQRQQHQTNSHKYMHVEMLVTF